jgi:hypothetical protein
MLVVDLLGHRCLAGRSLDQLGVQQLVFALVMDVQHRDAEIDVVRQERDPRWSRRRGRAYWPHAFLVCGAERGVDDRHVAHVDWLCR